MMDAPVSAAVGQAVAVAVSGLKPGAFYRLAFEPPAGRAGRIICERTLDRPYRAGSSTKTYTFRGRVPRTLRCGLRGDGARTGTAKVRPGAYRWVVGRRTGHGTWDKAFTILVAHVTVTGNALAG